MDRSKRHRAPALAGRNMGNHVTRLGVIATLLLSASTACADDIAGLRFTREGTMFRVAAADDAAGAKQDYIITERVQDDPDTAALRIDLTVKNPMPLRDILMLMVEGRDVAVRFTGQRAMEAASLQMGPALLSGTLKTTAGSLAQQVGLQAYIRPQQIEIVERRSYHLTIPSFENTTEMASRMKMTRAGNVRIALGGIDFDADADGYRDTQALIRETRAGRRGTGAFLSRMTQAETLATGKTDPVSRAMEDPAVIAQRIRNAEAAIASNMQGAPKVSTDNDALARPISVEFQGDATEALRRIVQAAGIGYKVVRAPGTNLAVTLKLKQVPLREALDALDREMKGKADLVYVRMSQRVDFVAH